MFSAISKQTGAAGAALISYRSSGHKLPPENNSSASAAERRLHENISLTKYWSHNAPTSKSEEWTAEGTSVSVTQSCGRMRDIYPAKGNKSCETCVSSEGDNWWSRCSQTDRPHWFMTFFRGDGGTAGWLQLSSGGLGAGFKPLSRIRPPICCKKARKHHGERLLREAKASHSTAPLIVSVKDGSDYNKTLLCWLFLHARKQKWSLCFAPLFIAKARWWKWHCITVRVQPASPNEETRLVLRKPVTREENSRRGTISEICEAADPLHWLTVQAPARSVTAPCVTEKPAQDREIQKSWSALSSEPRPDFFPFLIKMMKWALRQFLGVLVSILGIFTTVVQENGGCATDVLLFSFLNNSVAATTSEQPHSGWFYR